MLSCSNNVSLSLKAVIGLAAAIILSLLRMIQGLCLGGQYGGAITYVAEHVEDKHRGYYTR